jgi:hypothetical protein
VSRVLVYFVKKCYYFKMKNMEKTLEYKNIDLDFDLGEFSEMFEIPDMDIKESIVGKNRIKKPKADFGVNQKKVKYANAKKFVNEQSESILAGDRIFALLGGSFQFGDVVEAFLIENDLWDAEVSMSSLSISASNVGSLYNCLHRMKSLDMVLSANFFAKDGVNIIPIIYEMLDEDNKFQLSISSTHTKNILIKVGDRKIVMHGSANLRSSGCVEFVDIETNEVLYDHLKEYHDLIREKYYTINKDVKDPLKKKSIRNRNPHMKGA